MQPFDATHTTANEGSGTKGLAEAQVPSSHNCSVKLWKHDAFISHSHIGVFPWSGAKSLSPSLTTSRLH